ncbi:uncharacterized protein [Periplaneta americana]|uniref:uncharacterized protein isoform X2 n=1 Tax=Periplaneta americana TaxID=6978 RepID=UPI0037E8B89C
MATTTTFATVIIGLLTTYCYRVPPVLAIPDKKDIYVEDDWPLRRSYRLEDFLWSGSGDGQPDGGSGSGQDPGGGVGSTWRTTTIVRTTTVLTTIYPTPLYTTTYVQEHSQHTPSPCSSGVCTPSWSTLPSSVPSGPIEPTPTLSLPSPTVRPPGPEPNASVPTPDPRFWLLTVLRVESAAEAPATKEMEDRLARLYKIAFTRHQERHLGIGNATAAQLRSRRARDHRVPDNVSVHVHNKTSKGEHELELLYSVHVAGKPVPAPTAAEDMKLVSNSEVTAQLGYPVITKAELPLDREWRRGRARDTWLLVGAAIAAVSLLLLLIVLIALGLSKRKRSKRRVLAGGRQPNGQQQFEEGGGTANLAYQDDVDAKGQSKSGSTVWVGGSKTSPSFLPVGPATTVTFKDDIEESQKRKGSSTSLSSGESSGTSLVRRRAANGRKGAKTKIRQIDSRQRESDRDEEVSIVQDYPKPQPRKRQHISTRPLKVMHSSHGTQTAVLSSENGRRKAQEAEEADSNDELPVCDSPPARRRVGATISPNSFLSMPSIKAFPRGANIPEPLARVLEPMSVRHLDSEGGGIIVEPVRRLARHGSMEGEDPGVIGPLVWDLHCHRVQCQQQHQGYLDDTNTVEDLVLEAVQEDIPHPDNTSGNVGRMRRRFHELLDDAFSLFGSRSGSPGAEEDSSSPPTLHRVHSAIVRPVGEPLLGPSDTAPRPRTSDPRRPATAAAGVARPRGAWGTCNPSPHSGRSGTLPRPLSAGPFHRPQLPGPVEITIDRTLMLSDSQLPPTDPAIPLIAAIKEELRKFQGTNVHPAISLPGSTSTKP